MLIFDYMKHMLLENRIVRSAPFYLFIWWLIACFAIWLLGNFLYAFGQWDWSFYTFSEVESPVRIMYLTVCIVFILPFVIIAVDS